MVKKSISRIKRRKRERAAALKEFTELAADLNIQLLEVHGIRPEVMEDAFELLMEARASLRGNANAVVQSASPVTGIYITVANIEAETPEMHVPETCPACESEMMEHIQTEGSFGPMPIIESWDHICLNCGERFQAVELPGTDTSDTPGSQQVH